MKKIFDWIKRNKLTSALIVVVLYLLVGRTPIALLGMRSLGSMGVSSKGAMYYDSYSSPVALEMAPSTSNYRGQPATPQLDVEERKVVTNTSLSMVVKDVVNTIRDIKEKTKVLDGYMVNSWVRSPEEGGTGYISIRVPSDKLDLAMETFRGLAVKIVDESVDGTDITDQYINYEEQLRILQRTKLTFEGILIRAEEIDDILNVQQKILNIQSQIDAIEGKLRYMEATSSSSVIAINLSTDELSLPYAPSTWRPNVVYKYAVRALVQDLRKIANTSIWIGVYSVIWLPLLVVVLVARKIILKKRQRI